MKLLKKLFSFQCYLIVAFAFSVSQPALGLTEKGKTTLESLRTRLIDSGVDFSSDNDYELVATLPQKIVKPWKEEKNLIDRGNEMPQKRIKPKENPAASQEKQERELQRWSQPSEPLIPPSPKKANPPVTFKEKPESSEEPPVLPSKDGGVPVNRPDGDAITGLPSKDGGVPVNRPDGDAITGLSGKTEKTKKLMEKLRESLKNKDVTPGSRVEESGISEASKKFGGVPRLSEKSNSKVKIIDLPGSRPPDAPPKKSTTSDPVSKEKPAKEIVGKEQASNNFSGGRSFGELSDEELIQYANEHVWSSAKTKKHLPPPTPPYRPAKAKKAESKETSKEKPAKTRDKADSASKIKKKTSP